MGAAARVGARVNVQGVRTLVTEFKSLLTTLRDVRKELDGINAAGASGSVTPGRGGVGVGASNQNHSTLASSIAGWKSQFGSGAGMLAAGAGAAWALGKVTDRFNRNLNESIGISQGNMLLSSMYGMSYGTMERARVAALGNFAMSRQEALGAQAIGLSYGMSAARTSTFLSQTVAPLVQASGGTITPTQAASMGGTFLDPFTQRRAMAMGVGLGKVGGQVQNPLNTALGYIKNYEQRTGVKLNQIDFENMRSPGSPTRYTLKRLYMLTDEAVDTIVQAGMQNIQFQNTTGNAGATIDFTKSSDLAQIGMRNNRLGMKAFQLMTAQTSREARFFQNQEGSMVGKLQQDINIENTLSDVEQAFGDLIGPLGEFQKYIKLATSALMLFGGGGMLMGGGGGLLGGGGGGGGLIGGAVRGVASARGISTMRAAGGLGLLAGGTYAAMTAGSATGSSYGGTGGWGAVGSSAAMSGAGMAMLGAGPVGIGVGAVAAGVLAAKNYFDGKHARDVAKGRTAALTMTDEQIIGTIGNYLHPGWRGSGGAGPGETANMDILQMRRGALVAALLASANEGGMFNDPQFKGTDASKISDLVGVLGSSKAANDIDFAINMGQAAQYVDFVKRKDPKLYSRFFGNTSAVPWDMSKPILSEENQSLVLSNQDVIAGANTGDPMEKWGDPVEDKATSRGATWANLDNRMKERLLALFRASGGRVWLGNGWRSTDQQRTLFLSRYEPDPNGDTEWDGKRWKHVRGAPAAPPGRSMHEIGLAADLDGDLNWVQANAGRFGLKTFANVNNEPWHVQPSELPNSRRQYEGSGGGATDTGSSEMVSSGGGGGGGGGATSSSGINYSIAAAGPSTYAASTAASSTAGTLGQATGAPPGGVLSAVDVARVASAAGFRGNDLVTAVAIAMRESGGNASAHNTNTDTGDNSYGLWQINMLGSLGEVNAKRFGLSSYDDLLNASVNARAAFTLYQMSGNTFYPWGGYKGMDPTSGTDLNSARQAVQQAGLGDGAFALTGNTGSGGGIHIDIGGIHIVQQATGVLQYDSQQLARATLSVLEENVAEAVKRAS